MYGWKGSFKAHAVKAMILNILAATQQSQNWVVKARGRSTNSTLQLLKSYHPLWHAALPSLWSKRQVTLAGGCFHGIWYAVFGTDRLKPMLQAVSTVQLCWPPICLRSGSDGPLHLYCWSSLCINAFQNGVILGQEFTDMDVGRKRLQQKWS